MKTAFCNWCSRHQLLIIMLTVSVVMIGLIGTAVWIGDRIEQRRVHHYVVSWSTVHPVSGMNFTQRTFTITGPLDEKKLSDLRQFQFLASDSARPSDDRSITNAGIVNLLIYRLDP